MVRSTRRFVLHGALAFLVVVALLLAGCSAKKDKDDAPTDRVTVPVTPAPLGLFGSSPAGAAPVPKDCRGCIPLEQGAPAQRTQAAGTDPTTFTVPAPAMGDHIVVHGTSWADPATTSGMAIPLGEDGLYLMEAMVRSVTTRAPVAGAHGPFVAIEFVNRDGSMRLDDLLFSPESQTAWVDPADRMVRLVESSGFAAPRVDTILYAFGSVGWIPTEARTVPEAETLFWLGSHAWGRTWTEGERVSWSTPGTDIRWTYAVDAIEGPPRHEAPVLRLLATAEIGDSGLTRSWSLVFRTGSPYPVSIDLVADHVYSLHPVMPPELLGQRTSLIARGADPLMWPPLPEGPVEEPAFVLGDGYRVDERFGSPVLDELPVYPLRAAIDDLRRLSLEFQTWIGDHPQNVLLSARLTPLYATKSVGEVAEYRWWLTFTDGHGYHRGWEAVRAASTDGAVAPVAHRAGPADPDLGVRGDQLRAANHAKTRLSSTDGLGAVLRDFGVTGPVDSVVYLLGLGPDGELHGTVRVGHAAGVTEPSGTGRHLGGGFAIADLRSGTVSHLVRITADEP